MFTPTMRVAMAIGMLFMAFILGANGKPYQGVFLFTGFCLATGCGYFRNGTIWLAFRAARRQDWARMQRLVNQIRYPSLLSSQSRSYYDWMQGMTAALREDWPGARAHYERAMRGDLRTVNNRAILECGLAEACFHSGDVAAAAEHFARARTIAGPALQSTVHEVERLFERV